MVEIKVNVTRQEVKASEKTVLEAETPGGLNYKASFTQPHLEELSARTKKKMNSRKEYKSLLFETVFLKMHPSIPKLEPFLPSMTVGLDELIKAFSIAILKVMGLDTYVPAQKTVAESMEELNAKSKKQVNAKS